MHALIVLEQLFRPFSAGGAAGRGVGILPTLRGWFHAINTAAAATDTTAIIIITINPPSPFST